jgi:hypothetical protein
MILSTFQVEGKHMIDKEPDLKIKITRQLFWLLRDSWISLWECTFLLLFLRPPSVRPSTHTLTQSSLSIGGKLRQTLTLHTHELLLLTTTNYYYTTNHTNKVLMISTVKCVKGSGFSVQGSGFSFQGSRLRVQGLVCECMDGRCRPLQESLIYIRYLNGLFLNQATWLLRFVNPFVLMHNYTGMEEARFLTLCLSNTHANEVWRCFWAQPDHHATLPFI